MRSNVALIGLPGVGKSTVGRQLSRRLCWQFFDSDHIIESRYGCTVAEAFRRHGEAHFRDTEATVIDELTAPGQDGRVVSTGGGAILRADTRDRLRERCKVVYLHSTPEDICRRLRHDGSRPLFDGVDPLQTMRVLFSERDPLYRDAAHFVVETVRPSIKTLVNSVFDFLQATDTRPL